MSPETTHLPERPIPRAEEAFDLMWSDMKASFESDSFVQWFSEQNEYNLAVDKGQKNIHVATAFNGLDVKLLCTSIFKGKSKRQLNRKSLGDYRKYVFDLIKAGEVEGRVADIFFDMVLNEGFEKLNKLYEILVRVAVPEGETEGNFVENARLETRLVLESLGRATDSEGDSSIFWIGLYPLVDYRIYLSPVISEEVCHLIKELFQDLVKENVTHTYIKFTRLGRKDAIVINFNALDSQKVGLALEKLLSPPHMREVLLKESLPTGIQLTPGVTLAAEPPVNALVKIADLDRKKEEKKRTSNNKLHAAMMAMAYVFAQQEIGESDSGEDDILKTLGKKYYIQMLKLAGISPETLMPLTINNGKIPHSLEHLGIKLAA